jgi:hypothetical protein
VNPFPKRRRKRRYINLCGGGGGDGDGDGNGDGDGDGQRDLLVEGCSGDTMVVSVRPSDSIRGVKQKIENQVRSWSNRRGVQVWMQRRKEGWKEGREGMHSTFPFAFE